MILDTLFVAVLWGLLFVGTGLGALTHLVYLDYEQRWIAALRREHINGKLMAAARVVRLGVTFRLCWLVGMLIAEFDAFTQVIFTRGRVDPSDVRSVFYTACALAVVEVWAVAEEKTRHNAEWFL